MSKYRLMKMTRTRRSGSNRRVCFFLFSMYYSIINYPGNMSSYSFSETDSESNECSNTDDAPDISLSSILKALPLYEVTFSIADILKYSVLVLGILIILLYLFPGSIVMILLLMLLIVTLLIALLIKRANNSPNYKLGESTINSERLQNIRDRLLDIRSTIKK